MSKDRVTLRADDAVLAMCELRFSIERDDNRIAAAKPEDEDDAEHLASLIKFRAVNWQAYQRIAKALGLKPTLSSEAESAVPEISDKVRE